MISGRPTNRNLQISTAPTKAKSRDAFAFSRRKSRRSCFCTCSSHQSYSNDSLQLCEATGFACHCGPDIGPRLNVKTCMHNFPEVRDGGDIPPCPPSGYATVNLVSLYEIWGRAPSWIRVKKFRFFEANFKKIDFSRQILKNFDFPGKLSKIVAFSSKFSKNFDFFRQFLNYF